MDETRQYQQMPLRIKRYFSQLTSPELTALLDNLDKLENGFLIISNYPEITYRNRKLLSYEERDKKFVETIFSGLYSMCDNCRLPFVKVVRHYLDSYSYNFGSLNVFSLILKDN